MTPNVPGTPTRFQNENRYHRHAKRLTVTQQERKKVQGLGNLVGDRDRYHVNRQTFNTVELMNAEATNNSCDIHHPSDTRLHTKPRLHVKSHAH